MMDCNKEEALRAKDIALQKMHLKDFDGARKLALKAQKLYPELENVVQIITVCDVHCSAEQKLYASEMDWYGILQVEPTAVEITIKKQYRKFALQLHPDKNRFPGAEAAFKLIGEAQRVLLDHQRRAMHDMRRKVPVSRPTIPPYPQQKVNKSGSVDPKTNSIGGQTFFNSQQSRPSTTPQGNGIGPTFWTVCMYCSVRFQYYRAMLNKIIVCQNCHKTFSASEWKEPQARPTDQSQETFPKNNFRQRTFKPDSGCKVDVSAKKPEVDVQKAGLQFNAGCENLNGKKKRKRKSDPSESSDSIDSSESEEDVEVDSINNMDSFLSSAENRRRSSRKKHQVSYKENLSDDDDVGLSVPSKRREDESPPSGVAVGEKQRESNQKQHSHAQENLSKKRNQSGEERENVEVGGGSSEADPEGHNGCEKGSTSKAAPSRDTYVYPDPEFSDFNVKAESLAVGQIWAAFDNFDAMPRYYCLIKKKVSPGFKVTITWLEADPEEEHERNWAALELPTCCGNYGHGETVTSSNIQMFSHMVSWETGARKNAYKIHPKKGETWALFKNWNIMWYLDGADAHRSFEYEFVEIVSDYDEGEGVCVAYLGKLRGFVSLFVRVPKNGMETFQIPRAEVFRFAYRVPSFQMSGNEREGVPKGSHELDPACLPNIVEEISLPENLDVLSGKAQPTSKTPRSSPRLRGAKMSDGSSSSNVGDSDAEGSNLKRGSNTGFVVIDVDEIPLKPNGKDVTPMKMGARSSSLQGNDSKGPTDKEKLGGTCTSSNAEAPEIPAPQFHNFAPSKSEGSFHRGQVWALYSDPDGMPRKYCQIKKVDSHPKFKVNVNLLNSSSPPDITVWDYAEMPVSCGNFRVTKSKDADKEYTDTASFSHQVHADHKRNAHHIVPKREEIWAMYKNWTPKFTLSDLDNSQYDIVEVLASNDGEIQVSFMERVKDSVSVFKSQKENGATVIRKITRAELYRFSHRIPAFKLTAEHDKSMIGFWELDPEAMPMSFFS